MAGYEPIAPVASSLFHGVILHQTAGSGQLGTATKTKKKALRASILKIFLQINLLPQFRKCGMNDHRISGDRLRPPPLLAHKEAWISVMRGRHRVRPSLRLVLEKDGHDGVSQEGVPALKRRDITPSQSVPIIASPWSRRKTMRRNSR